MATKPNVPQTNWEKTQKIVRGGVKKKIVNREGGRAKRVKKKRSGLRPLSVEKRPAKGSRNIVGGERRKGIEDQRKTQ